MVATNVRNRHYDYVACIYVLMFFIQLVEFEWREHLAYLLLVVMYSKVRNNAVILF